MLSDERRKAAAEDDARAMKQMRERLALEYHYKDLENFDFDGDGELDKDELEYKRNYKEAQIYKMKHPGRNTDDGYPNIFDEADKKPGEYVEYNKQYGYENKVSPASGKIVRVGKTYNASAKKEIDHPNWYRMNAGDMKGLIENGDIIPEDKNKVFKAGEFSGDTQFEADGYIVKKPIYKKDKTGKRRIVSYGYYMSGQLKQLDGTTDLVPKNAKTSRALILLNERDANYAEQQKKDKSVDTTN